MGGGGGSSGPTVQQQQLQTQQALTTANLNLEENSQRKAILNSMQGTRVFRGSALSRALAGNTPGSAASTSPPPGPSPSQNLPLFAPGTTSLLDKASQRGAGSGSTSSGGTGTSGGGGTTTGGRAGG